MQRWQSQENRFPPDQPAAELPGAGFLQTIFTPWNIPILKGQGFSEEELSSSGRFVVLSKLLADRLFPGEDPIGQQIQVPKLTGPLYTVVGVAQNVKNGGLRVKMSLNITASDVTGPKIGTARPPYF